MEENSGYVLAMYDVRGIQNYIFHTPQVKDAIGASAIVEDIIFQAIQHAIDKLSKKWSNEDKKNISLEWCNETAPLEYKGYTNKKVQLLYIGGGNGLLICESRDLCVEMNKLMAKYVLEQTYSLQLAAAMVDVSGNYEEDHTKLMKEMDRVKAEMVVSRPIGALPVMEAEAKTGYPVVPKPKELYNDTKEKAGTESYLKKLKEQDVREGIDSQIKKFENYATQKGTDSTIAVVHIDGNNMGLRIRDLMKGVKDYKKAVERMRHISYNISHSYAYVFEQMKDLFNKNAGVQEAFKDKKTDNFVLKILVAGDDITYVCNAKIALATVDYFCREITKRDTYSLAKGIEEIEDGEWSDEKYAFSFCAGIAYINNHFPFSVGYEVAEECCKNAKDLAKEEKNKKGDIVGNWIDFHICKNVQAQDLEAMRAKEYMTSHGEQLLRRPYFICTKEEGWPISDTDSRSISSLKKNILHFQNKGNMPRSFSKNLRNLYPLGENQVIQFQGFLRSRNCKLPDGTGEFYEKESADSEPDSSGNEITVAKWYDALEMMDYYIDLKQIEGEEA